MSAPTQRHRHQIALQAAANLLTHPVPDVFSVQVTYNHVIRIMPASVDSLDAVRIAFHQWAAQLDDPQWSVAPHGADQRKLVVIGTWLGQHVEVWKLISVDGPDLAELSTRPELDTKAGVA